MGWYGQKNSSSGRTGIGVGSQYVCGRSKTREIGSRKVFGATVQGIMAVLCILNAIALALFKFCYNTFTYTSIK